MVYDYPSMQLAYLVRGCDERHAALVAEYLASRTDLDTLCLGLAARRCADAPALALAVLRAGP
eukprot:4454898-Pleurochrysis_carterae.AAC.5